MKKILILGLSVLLMLIVVSCSNKSEASKTAYEVTDSQGEVVKFEKAPEKVISLLPSDTEIIYALGENDKLVAVSTYCNYPEDTNNKPKIDAGVNTNVEEIIALDPDLVIFGMMSQTEDQIALLRSSGINVFVTYAGSIEDAYNVIEMLGSIFKKNEEASNIVKNMKSEFEDIQNQVKELSSKRVYIEISPLEYGLWTCGTGTFQDELLTLVGAENIFSDVQSWGQVSEEQVLSRDPEVIISTFGTMFDSDTTIEEIKNRKNWSEVLAVASNNVYVIDSDAIQRPGPRLVNAARDLIKYIYGE